ncbi:F-box/kelch-repeat protein At3g06240-like [Papaver somniferum]|uniref:F-box/kelch-repeat protein At3g06240-like n=1 Tax=Papaver somniferum TaxID=3469 RepID=UPI000E6FE7B5|nr:F-box/kelch-repeat protein At3g06240-like [Papaver somniferum]
MAVAREFWEEDKLNWRLNCSFISLITKDRRDNASLSARRYKAVQLDYPSVSEGDYTSLPTSSTERLYYDAAQLDYPSEEGLYSRTPDLEDNEEINNICVWNPTTREYKYKKFAIPPSEFYYCELDCDYVDAYCNFSNGFGYDSSMDDYRFVKIDHHKRKKFYKLEVYTLGSGVWKTIEKIPYSFREKDFYSNKNDHPGLFLNGALHWLGFSATTTKKTSSSQLIVTFDINNERLTDLSIPEETKKQRSTYGHMDLYMFEFMQQDSIYNHIGVLKDCLCLIHRGPFYIEVWVMLDYGVKESWTKQFAFNSRSARCDPVYPLWNENGYILMVGDNSFVLYDRKDDEVKHVDVVAVAKDNIKLKKSNNAIYCYYMESLVPLNSGTYVEKRIVVDRIKKKP